jgi:hypothetical protein
MRWMHWISERRLSRSNEQLFDPCRKDPDDGLQRHSPDVLGWAAIGKTVEENLIKVKRFPLKKAYSFAEETISLLAVNGELEQHV